MRALRITSILALLSLALLPFSLTMNASADTGRWWEVKISEPASLIKTSEVAIEYTVLSTVANDQFKIELLDSSNTTTGINTFTGSKGGDSGIFSLNLVNGDYKYKIKATNISAAEVKTTDVVEFTVAVPAAQIVTISTTTSSSTTDGSTTAISTNAGTSVSSSASSDAEAATNTEEPSSNESVTETSSDTAGTVVEGEQDKNSEENNSVRNTAIIVLIVIAVGAATWFIFSRFNKSEVS